MTAVDQSSPSQKSTRDTSPETEKSTRPRRSDSAWFSAFSRIHFIAGIFIAPLIFIAAFSGFFYAFAPSLEQLVYKDEITATSGTAAQPLGDQIAAARKVYPDLSIKGVQVAEDTKVGDVPQTNTRVLFKDSSLESSSYTHAVFVDPGDLSIKGDLIQYGSSSALPLRTWLSNGHRRLWLGDPGRIYSETAASWLGPLAVSGLALWLINRRRRSNQANTRKPRRGSRRLASQRHSFIGVIAVPGLLFLCLSGLTWSLVAGTNITNVRSQLDWMPPKPSTSLSASSDATPSQPADPHAEHGGHGPDQSLPAHRGNANATSSDSQAETVLESARQAGDLTGTLELTPPANNDSAWVASEIRQPYKLHNDTVSVNGNTGEITDRIPFSSWPIAAQASAWIIQLHMGMLFGIYTQIALGLLALAILALVIYGYTMWFKRGRGSRAGSLPAPIVWSELPVWARVVIPLVLLAYCIVAPLFAVSLVVFAVISLIWRLSTRES
ncbi:PepSY domain-containing protein [Corynebacterium sp. 4HC-13]|uniref:PepSY-associated TM helix domain-containing protein n=1 Tax=Corynebacterium anserum TaxID=2684406 RepID=UPI0016399BE6|nr:PepSY domain-containing protein [Corynebacterium anserum]MBC2680851.1 PepSY domain-containing protein [Corynebacterium anserum]